MGLTIKVKKLVGKINKWIEPDIMEYALTDEVPVYQRPKRLPI